MPKSDLPFGSEFSPNQIDLPTLLEIISQHHLDKDGFENSLKENFFRDNKTTERNKQKLAMNLRLSLKAYQIIDDEIQFTDFGNKLFNLRNDPNELYTDNRVHIRGLALEALAFKLMRIIDLDYVATRLRGNATGGAEVDLLFESSRLVFSRWQVQCKNTSRVTLDDVAKEV